MVRRNEPKPPGLGAETRSSVVDRHILAPPKPIRYIINTGRHTPITSAATRSCATRAARSRAAMSPATSATPREGAAILAHENVLMRLAHAAARTAGAAGRRAAHRYLLHRVIQAESLLQRRGRAAAAHAEGAHRRRFDRLFPRQRRHRAWRPDVHRSYPVIDVAKGGTINGIIDGLNRVLDLVDLGVPAEGGTMMVPGHGRIVDSADVAYYRDMMTIIRDRVQDMVKKGDDARPSEGREADRRLRHASTGHDGPMDHGHVHRGGLQEPGRRTDPAPRAPIDRHGGVVADPSRRAIALPCWLRVGASAPARLRGAAARAAAPPTRAAAPIDLTGSGCRSSPTTGAGAWSRRPRAMCCICR